MHSKYIGNVEEEEGFYLPCKGALSQYRCMNLSKTDDNDRAHIEIMQTPWTSVSFDEQLLKSLILKSGYSCASSATAL